MFAFRDPKFNKLTKDEDVVLYQNVDYLLEEHFGSCYPIFIRMLKSNKLFY